MAAMWGRFARQALSAAVQGSAGAMVHRSMTPTMPIDVQEPMRITCSNSLVIDTQSSIGIGAAAAGAAALTMCAVRSRGPGSGAVQTTGEIEANVHDNCYASEVPELIERMNMMEQSCARLGERLGQTDGAVEEVIDNNRLSNHERDNVVEELMQQMVSLRRNAESTNSCVQEWRHVYCRQIEQVMEEKCGTNKNQVQFVQNEQREQYVKLYGMLEELPVLVMNVGEVRPSRPRTTEYLDIASTTSERFERGQRAECAEACFALQRRTAESREAILRYVMVAWTGETMLNVASRLRARQRVLVRSATNPWWSNPPASLPRGGGAPQEGQPSMREKQVPLSTPTTARTPPTASTSPWDVLTNSQELELLMAAVPPQGTALPAARQELAGASVPFARPLSQGAVSSPGTSPGASQMFARPASLGAEGSSGASPPAALQSAGADWAAASPSSHAVKALDAVQEWERAAGIGGAVLRQRVVGSEDPTTVDRFLTMLERSQALAVGDGGAPHGSRSNVKINAAVSFPKGDDSKTGNIDRYLEEFEWIARLTTGGTVVPPADKCAILVSLRDGNSKAGNWLRTLMRSLRRCSRRSCQPPNPVFR